MVTYKYDQEMFILQLSVPFQVKVTQNRTADIRLTAVRYQGFG